MEPEPTDELPVIRIMVVDDHPAVRQGLVLLLALDGIVVCREASDRAEALAGLKICRPDLVLVDLSLGDEDGLDLVADLRARAVPMLVYSMHEDAHHVENAFAAGALGYVTKRSMYQVLVQAIREVAAGRRFVCPQAALALADRIIPIHPQDVDSRLSEHERQIYHMLGEGEGTIEIAAALRISARTVESYFTRIQDKLGIDGMRDLRRHAILHLRKHDP